MSSQMKGLLGVVLGLNSLVPILITGLLRSFPGRPLIPEIVLLLLAVAGYKLSRQGKNGGAVILGTLGVALNALGMLRPTYFIFAIISSAIFQQTGFL